MDVRRRAVKPLDASKHISSGEPLRPRNQDSSVKASDALPLPLYLTNGLFFTMFFSVMYFLLHRWREKIRDGIPLHVLNFSELVAMFSLIASVIYLLGFFGIGFVQSFVSKGNNDSWDVEDETPEQFIDATVTSPPVRRNIPMKSVPVDENAAQIITPFSGEDDEVVIKSVVEGRIPSYSLESKLGDCKRAAFIRKEALQRTSGKSLDGLPLDGFDYESILGQCCEMPIGYIQIPVGIAGPLLLNGNEFSVPMATTEGCLVASTNRGCKAIYVSGGATSVLFRDGMTRAPVVRFGSAKRAAELKFFVEDTMNFETLSVVFNKSSRFARLQNIQCAIAGKNLYMRFSCSTGDAMGMNMVSKGVQNVLDYLQNEYPDMDIIGISGNYCSDKKPAAVNWIEGRGKSVVCEAIIKEEVVKKVLKTEVAALVELNMLKNLTGSAMAGALGGFNAHASNIVSAVYLATGQDPAQNIESSHCITMMEAVNDGKDLHISVTMPSIELQHSQYFLTFLHFFSVNSGDRKIFTMDVRRRAVKPLDASKHISSGEPLRPHNQDSSVKASDALPLPLYLTNGLFFTMFFSVMYFLLHRWREKIRNGIPLHVLNFSELVAIFSLIASVIYLLGFFGIGFVQSFVSKGNNDSWDVEDETPEQFIDTTVTSPPVRRNIPMKSVPVDEKDAQIITPFSLEDDEVIIKSVVEGRIPSYSLESKLGDCKRAAFIRKEALQRSSGKSLDGLPLDGFDYESILGQCCEMPIGYIQIPVGIAGPLLLNGNEFSVPMATTEGCLVASTNRGCKAIYVSGGATSVLFRDGMTRAPVVRFGSAKRAAELKFFVEDTMNFETLSVVFNKSSRFARLQNIQCAIAGKNLYMRFSCSTGDAMGMNMVSKGVQNVLDYLQNEYPDMDIIGISGNYCSDKKPAAVNWIEGRGKSVVCEAIIKEEVVKKVLKTEVAALVELNMLKNLTGSAMAGALGGFNAHASNIVSAVYLATGQDPAQNIESSHCITMMEAVNDGKDLHISVTMPSIEGATSVAAMRNASFEALS
uniref:3-hydroxy-3-methylglutaryl coenzyme A reductase n=1 Tax=Solanum lycopersicum TaxID=4081 RepID=A0A3Q7FFH0_SOLLC